MKIGRNAPCPCGSEKKYKKCCLDKNLTPPEALNYRRLSKALDELMPKLIDHGFSVFGHEVYGLAMAEFFGWPDPEELPDDKTVERMEMLFWPWFVFNWEYDSLEFEDESPEVPEEATIAELYLESQRVDPRSPAGKLIHAANRTPYSFLEIISVNPGKSLRIKDVMTGADMIVQERAGSEMLSKGDIVYGRVVRIDDVGMFLGLSAFVLPPGIKPQLIDLRRSLSEGRKKLSNYDLYDWDLEIREFFLEMDRVLHTRPELRNTDDDPMDSPEIQRHITQILETHWDSWVDQKIPALGSKTPKQAIRTADGREAVEALLLDAEKMTRNDPIRSSFEMDMIAGVRRRLKLDKPLPPNSRKPDAEQAVERIAQIKGLIAAFGDQRLNDTYTGFATVLCDAIAASDLLNIHRGRIEIWAAAVVYAIAQLNFLFSRETPHHLTPDELCNWFKVKKTTVSSKAASIRNTLDLFFDDERFCAPHVTNVFQFFEDENGFVFPALSLEPTGEKSLEPIPLKAPPETAKSKKAGKTKTAEKKRDDRQLSLFDD